tara:strand:- start:1424 stop:1747 length:324 start_codon:yes stop_codon:yes gene_type:complete
MIPGFTKSQFNTLLKIFLSIQELQQVILYGSRAKGNYSEGSDVDITLKGEKVNHQTLQNLSKMVDDSSLPYQFDISIFSTIENQDLIDHMNRVGQLIYSKNKTFKEA